MADVSSVLDAKDGDWCFPTPGKGYHPALTKTQDKTKSFFFSPWSKLFFFGCEKKKKISIVGLYHVSKGGEGFCPQSSCPNICLLHSGE